MLHNFPKQSIVQLTNIAAAVVKLLSEVPMDVV
jgi:hypothetical protein